MTITTDNKHGLYIGTYAKYNNGSIAGDWFYLEDYNNAKDFWQAVKETHKDEKDPEYDIQDTDNLDGNISLDYINRYYQEMEDLTDDEKGIVLEYWQEVDSVASASYILDRFHSNRSDWNDTFNINLDFGYYIAEESGLEIPEGVGAYFDYEEYGRDLFYDFTLTSNYTFYNY